MAPTFHHWSIFSNARVAARGCICCSVVLASSRQSEWSCSICSHLPWMAQTGGKHCCNIIATSGRFAGNPFPPCCESLLCFKIFHQAVAQRNCAEVGRQAVMHPPTAAGACLQASAYIVKGLYDDWGLCAGNFLERVSK